MLDGPFLSLTEVCHAARVQPNNMRQRIMRKQYNLGYGPGHRRFTFVEACQTVLMVALENVGLSVGDAYEIATALVPVKLFREAQSKIETDKTSNRLKSHTKGIAYVAVLRQLGEQGKADTFKAQFADALQLSDMDLLFMSGRSYTSDLAESPPLSISVLQINALAALCFDRLCQIDAIDIEGAE